jgi:hypothetical protein
MKILVIFISHKMSPQFIEQVTIFNNYMKELPHTVEYAGISSFDDFENYETIIKFSYKMVNPKRQISKLSDFITTYSSSFDYDIFIKVRPEVKLLEQLNLNNLVINAVNARAREYVGPRNIQYGITVGGDGNFKHINGYGYDLDEKYLIIDDILFIFDKHVIKNNGFTFSDELKHYLDDKDTVHNEFTMTRILNSKNIKCNVIGINLLFYGNENYYAKSHDIIHQQLLLASSILMNINGNQVQKM